MDWITEPIPGGGSLPLACPMWSILLPPKLKLKVPPFGLSPQGRRPKAVELPDTLYWNVSMLSGRLTSPDLHLFLHRGSNRLIQILRGEGIWKYLIPLHLISEGGFGDAQKP